MQTFHNLLEPANLIRAFEDHPPSGFDFVTLANEAPAFAAPFDLLTTLDGTWRRRLESIAFLRGIFRRRTLFVGTTVSEYVLLPAATTSHRFVQDLLAHRFRYAFLIVKDIPSDAALVGESSLNASRMTADACSRAGFVLVEGQALAWVPIDFDSIDAFLSGMSHARRKNIRRKLRSRSGLAIEELPLGSSRFDDAAFIAELYGLYRNVYEQSEIHFDDLTIDFFTAVLRDATIAGSVFTYRTTGDELIGFNLCVHGDRMLIDKYVGFRYPEALHHELYTVSWFQNLQHALDHGDRYYVAGWTDPEIKRALGAQFTWTRHAVFVRNRLLRLLLRALKPLFETDRRWKSNHDAGDHSRL